MVKNQRPKPINFPELEAVTRITNIPIVETGWNYAGHIYNRIKNSNNLIFWTMDQAEHSIYNVIDTASPAVYLLEGPIAAIDKIICKSLDIVEQKVPSINLPPQMIYFNTKQYVSSTVGNKIVKPVLKRADSVKQIGNSVLASKYTAFAADKLDGALDVADKYVDKYLPADVFDNPGNDDIIIRQQADGPAGKAIQTSQHVFRFSKKLQRRLTRRTLLEAKALKDQSAEAIHVLVYVAELVATDPKLAFQKGKELWFSLSKDEPENQARPENLEQLIVLLSRETARRVVHLVNFTALGIGKVPKRMIAVMNLITSSCLQLLDSIFKTVHLDGVSQIVLGKAKTLARNVTVLLKQLNTQTTDLLEQLALVLSAQKEQANMKPLTTSNSAAIPLPPPPPQEHKPKPNKNTNYLPASPDSLRPPVARTSLKATHRHAANSVSNGETIKS